MLLHTSKYNFLNALESRMGAVKAQNLSELIQQAEIAEGSFESFMFRCNPNSTEIEAVPYEVVAIAATLVLIPNMFMLIALNCTILDGANFFLVRTIK